MDMPQKKHRILFVDDDPAAVSLVSEYLSEWFEVEVATTGEEAVLSCLKAPPALVLMDLMMPRSTNYEGDEAIQRLTTDPKTSAIPIIVQTGFSGARILLLVQQAPNIVGVLMKPYDLALMKKKIDVILNR